MKKTFRCAFCGKSELYLFKTALDRFYAKKDFEEKHKNCELQITNKNNVIPFKKKYEV